MRCRVLGGGVVVSSVTFQPAVLPKTFATASFCPETRNMVGVSTTISTPPDWSFFDTTFAGAASAATL